MAYEDYHVNADDVKLDGDPNIRRTVPPSPSSSGGGISYGTCTTAAATAAKVVTLADATGWELKQGASVAVKFSNTNTFSATAQDPVTLNVNNTGAKNIYYGGSANPTGTNTTAFGRANYVNTYVYDGTYWVWTGSSSDNNTTYSAMSKSELTTGTTTTSRVVRADYLHAGIEQIAESGDIDTANNTATFTSSDTTDASATSWTSVTKLASGESHKSIFAKMSQMFKNIRYLYKMLGTTDISSIGDGTVTGGLDTLKDALTTKITAPNNSDFKMYFPSSWSYVYFNHQDKAISVAANRDANITIAYDIPNITSNERPIVLVTPYSTSGTWAYCTVCISALDYNSCVINVHNLENNSINIRLGIIIMF